MVKRSDKLALVDASPSKISAGSGVSSAHSLSPRRLFTNESGKLHVQSYRWFKKFDKRTRAIGKKPSHDKNLVAAAEKVARKFRAGRGLLKILSLVPDTTLDAQIKRLNAVTIKLQKVLMIQQMEAYNR